MLTRADVEDILKLIDQSDFQELSLELGELKLHLRRKGAAPQDQAAPPPVAQPVALQTPAARLPAQAAGPGIAIPAPLLGTFWHAPRPGAAPFVQPGDTVAADTVIGIIEVMKLMNSVTAGIAGVVTEIVAPNGEMVEHGQCLIRVRAE